MAVPHSGHTRFDARRSYPHRTQQPGLTVRWSRSDKEAVGSPASMRRHQNGSGTHVRKITGLGAEMAGRANLDNVEARDGSSLPVVEDEVERVIEKSRHRGRGTAKP